MQLQAKGGSFSPKRVWLTYVPYKFFEGGEMAGVGGGVGREEKKREGRRTGLALIASATQGGSTKHPKPA
jgi:hypothetical protein